MGVPALLAQGDEADADGSLLVLREWKGCGNPPPCAAMATPLTVKTAAAPPNSILAERVPRAVRRRRPPEAEAGPEAVADPARRASEAVQCCYLIPRPTWGQVPHRSEETGQLGGAGVGVAHVLAVQQAFRDAGL